MPSMTRIAGRPLADALGIAALLSLLVAPTALAHHGAGAVDPRCVSGYPAESGVDLTVFCADQVPVTSPGDLDPGAAKLVPFIGAALVTGIALAVVAVIAMRYRKPAARPRATRKAWWVCPACHSMNAGDRVTCYACHAAAPAMIFAPTTAAPASVTPAPDPAPAPALDQPVGRPAG
jgi:hypothetical protein